jgi:hypothetical protein
MGTSPGVTTPSPSPVSSPVPTTPGQAQPSVAPQPKTGEEVKPGAASPGTPSGATDRGGFHNF